MKKSQSLLLVLFAFCFLTNFPYGAEAKLRVAVIDFKDESNRNFISQAMSRAMTENLKRELFKSHFFEVVEQERIDELAKQKGLVLQGLLNPEDIIDVGQNIKAGAVITGVINNYYVMKIPSVGNNEYEGHILLSLRIVDTVTGDVLLSAQCEGVSKNGKGANIFSGIAEREIEGETALAAAALNALRKGAQIICSSDKLVQPFSITRISGDMVIIDAGTTRGNVSRGDQFVAYVEGEPILNQEGEIVGVERECLAVLELKVLQPRYSKCIVVEGDIAPLKSGISVLPR